MAGRPSAGTNLLVASHLTAPPGICSLTLAGIRPSCQRASNDGLAVMPGFRKACHLGLHPSSVEPSRRLWRRQLQPSIPITFARLSPSLPHTSSTSRYGRLLRRIPPPYAAALSPTPRAGQTFCVSDPDRLTMALSNGTAHLRKPSGSTWRGSQLGIT